MDNFLEFLRKIMLIKINGGLGEFGVELDETSATAAEKLAKRFDYPSLISMIELFSAKKQEMKTAFIPQFPLEVAIVQICEEVVCRRDDDDDDDCGAGGSSVKEKIKEKISHLNPRKDKEDDIPLANIDLKKEKKDKPEIKVDFISDSHKVRPRGFVDFDKVKDGWPAIVEKMLEENYTLSALLKISQPLKCRDNVLEIGVRSRFYKDRLEDMRNRQILEKVISEVAKAAVSICGVIKDDLEPIEFEEKEAVPAAAVVPPSVSRSTVVIGPSSAPVKKNDSPIAIERPKDAAQEVASMF